MNILLTAGGTRVPIDSVRYIGNSSSCRYGDQLYEQFARLTVKAGVSYWRAKQNEPNKLNQPGPIIREFENYFDYLNVKDYARALQPDIIVSAAAVSDYILENPFEGKISSDNEEITLRLVKSEKIINSLVELCPKALVVGFKLLCNPSPEEMGDAILKQFKAGVDLVVFNDLEELKSGNQTRLIYKQGATSDSFSLLATCPTAGSLAQTILNYRNKLFLPKPPWELG